jgi:predicted aldo/keto reductase-like oxidoreductase
VETEVFAPARFFLSGYFLFPRGFPGFLTSARIFYLFISRGPGYTGGDKPIRGGEIMIYRPYGKTGKEVSILGFGGMRFAEIDNQEECAAMMVRAAEGGVNYFDTAPAYFGIKSEQVYGMGFAELRRRGLPYFVATKTFKSREEDVRGEIEGQLKRLDVPAIDFYHIWCITDLANWRKRKEKGVLDIFRKLKAEGLIKHICVSSHLTGGEINELLMEGVFEGVLFGYSAYNFKTREKAFNAIRAKGLGAVVMNPLGGGLIPQHPELFGFLKSSPGEGAAGAALRFLWDHRDITTTLVGFSTVRDVQEALAAVRDYTPRSEAELAAVKEQAGVSLEGICTGCGYCDECPQDIPIPKFMDIWNQKMLGAGPAAVSDRFRLHWGLDPKKAESCVACGACEAACTQHLDIIHRLKELAAIKL